MLSHKQLKEIEARSTDAASDDVFISQEDFNALTESVAEGLEVEFENDMLQERIETLEEEVRDLLGEIEVLTTESVDL